MKSWPPPPPPSTTFFIYFSSISILFSGSTAARTLVANRKAEDYTHMILEADVLDACSWTSFGMFRSRLTWDDDSPNYCWYARYALKSPTSHIIILHHIVSVCFSGVFFLDSWIFLGCSCPTFRESGGSSRNSVLRIWCWNGWPGGSDLFNSFDHVLGTVCLCAKRIMMICHNKMMIVWWCFIIPRINDFDYGGDHERISVFAWASCVCVAIAFLGALYPGLLFFRRS